MCYLTYVARSLLGAVLALSVASIQATLIPGNVVATFSGVQLNGYLANVPSAGVTSVQLNEETAVYAISNGATSSSLTWGSSAPTTAYQTYSEITFTGGQIPSSNFSTTPFQVGTIVFTNGTSDDDTQIFAVGLNFYDGIVSDATHLGSAYLPITTTGNVFGVPGGLTSGDDDYINICNATYLSSTPTDGSVSLSSAFCGTSIEAVESSEGGMGVTVNLMGTITGDPTLNFTSLALAPGQTAGTNGFLGTDPAIALAPEPAAWVITLGALGMLFLGRRRARRIKAA